MTRREFIGNGTAFVFSTAAFGSTKEDVPEVAAAKKWFRDAQYGLFVHWGLYALPAGEWRGHRHKVGAEWIMLHSRIPVSEYEKLASAFNPVCFNAEDYVKLAQDAGMKYIVFTAKHHDGFSMFHSKVTKYNSYDMTPARRDYVEEFAEACRKHAMKFCVYYSHDLDWHEKDGGCYDTNMGSWKKYGAPASPWCNDWDYPNPREKDFRRYLEGKAIPQVKELLTQYGEIGTIWYDMGYTLTKEQADALYDFSHRCQAATLVKWTGDGRFDFGCAGDNGVAGTVRHESFYEVPCTLNDNWGYCAHDQNWKSIEKVREIRSHLGGLGVNYLLNVGPDCLGRIPVPAGKILREARF